MKVRPLFLCRPPVRLIVGHRETVGSTARTCRVGAKAKLEVAGTTSLFTSFAMFINQQIDLEMEIQSEIKRL